MVSTIWQPSNFFRVHLFTNRVGTDGQGGGWVVGGMLSVRVGRNRYFACPRQLSHLSNDHNKVACFIIGHPVVPHTAATGLKTFYIQVFELSRVPSIRYTGRYGTHSLTRSLTHSLAQSVRTKNKAGPSLEYKGVKKGSA